MLRRIFGPRRDKVTVERGKIHDEEFNDLLPTKYCSGNQIEKNGKGGACSAYGAEIFTELYGEL